MSTGTRREAIITQVVTELEALSTIKTVERKKLQYAQLQNFALPQLPVAAVVGRLPVPRAHREQRLSGKRGRADILLSRLIIDVYVYFQERTDPDTVLSNLTDDVWRTLYADQTKNDLVIDTEVLLDENVEYWDPYVAFRAQCIVTYKHDTGGI